MKVKVKRKVFNDENYIDEVGGYHSPCDCYNPEGYFCGECNKMSCKNCSMRFMTPKSYEGLLNKYTEEELFDMTAGADMAKRDREFER